MFAQWKCAPIRETHDSPFCTSTLLLCETRTKRVVDCKEESM